MGQRSSKFEGTPIYGCKLWGLTVWGFQIQIQKVQALPCLLRWHLPHPLFVTSPHPHSSPPPPTREHSIFLPVNIKQTKKGHEHNTKAQGQKLRAHTWNTQGHKLQDKERVLPMHIKHVHIGHNHKEHTQQQELGSHTCTGTNLEKTL